VLEFAVSVIERIGVLGAGLLIALETVIAPLPSEVVLLLTGVNVSEGNFSFLGALLITTTGSLVGASLLYAAGYFFNEDRLEHLIARYGKFLGLTVGDLRKTLSWFERYGSPLVLFGRLVPIVRSLVSIPAGLVQMNFAKFLALTALGSGIWNTIWISLGFTLGENWHIAEQYSSILDYIAYAALGAALIYLLFRFVRRRRASRGPLDR
jgi:membrane protein DedA with SNARE-associated domain